MLVLFFRTIIVYTVVLIVTRLMGKREIGQMQPFEFVISIMIADLATMPLANSGIPISNGIIPICGLLTMHLVISLGNIKSVKIRELICGKPAILIYRGKINEEVLRKERYTVNELQEKLRDKDITNLGDIEYAILETSGQINVVLKPSKRGCIPEDFGIESEYEGMSYDLVNDGKILYDNLKKIGKEYNWLKKQIEKFGYLPEEALIVTIDAKGQIFSQKKEYKKR